MIRAFVGIAIPDEIAATLAIAQSGLPGRLSERENFHLTLVFLGELPGPLLEDVHYALDGVSAPGFQLSLDGVDSFGRPQPTTAHALIRPSEPLNHLRAKLARAAREAGAGIDSRRFTPHVTLARFGTGLGPDDMQDLAAWRQRRADFRAGPFDVHAFTLFRSHLGRKGAAYEVLEDYPLAPPQTLAAAPGAARP